MRILLGHIYLIVVVSQFEYKVTRLNFKTNSKALSVAIVLDETSDFQMVSQF
jgi:hypothetical protein